MFTDTHCHLNFNAFDADRTSVIEHARRVGVERILIPGIDIESSRQAIGLAQSFTEIYAAVGVHPHDAATWDKCTPDDLLALAQHPKAVALGEIGLDYYRHISPRDVQQNVFHIQLELAAKWQRPVIIHCRDAEADVYKILHNWCAGLWAERSPLARHPGVLHSFSGDKDFAAAVIQLGFFIGITGPVTFKNAQKLQEVVCASPLDRLLIETDAPFLTPAPYRGQRNEPSHVRLVAEKIGSLKGLSVEDVAKATSQNASTLFNNWRV
ncbi:MAG: TatD family hydrolase [Chloroflexota bacterium]